MTTRSKPTEQRLAFGQWIRRTREGHGLEIKELAARGGMSVSTVNALESGTGGKAPSIDVYVRLAKGLGVELGYVLHKAGFPIGKGDVNMVRLKRVEAAMAILDERAHEIRRALAEGLEHDVRPGMAERYGRALGALDLVTERLREDRKI